MKLHLELVFILLLLTGCAVTSDTNSQPVEETIISYKALPLPDLFIDVPENYQKTSSEFYEEYYICDDASIIITQDTREAKYISAYDYSIKALREYQDMTSSVELLNNEAVKTNGASNVQTLEFNYMIGEGDNSAKLTCLVGYLTDGTSMYIITCKSNTDTYQSHREEFFSVMHSAMINEN